MHLCWMEMGGAGATVVEEGPRGGYKVKDGSVDERWVELASKKIRLLVAGEGARTVVLWPGLGGTAESFLRLLREGATRGYLMVALDPPGLGLSDRIPFRDRRDAANVYLAVLAALGARTAVLGGHSYGAGATLAALAGSEPLRDRTRGVILYDGGYLPFDETPEERRSLCERYVEDFAFATWEDFIAAQRSEAQRWDKDMEIAARAAMLESGGRIRLRVSVDTCYEAMNLMADSIPKLLPRFDVAAALLLRAGQPTDMEEARVSGIKELRDRIPGLDVRTFPAASHQMLDEEPDGVAHETFSFLAHVTWA